MRKVKAFKIESEAYDGFILTVNAREIPQAVECMLYGEVEDCEIGKNQITVSVEEFEKEEFDKIMSQEWQP